MSVVKWINVSLIAIEYIRIITVECKIPRPSFTYKALGYFVILASEDLSPSCKT